MASIARTVRPLARGVVSAARPPARSSCLRPRGALSRRFSVLGPAQEKKYTKEHEWVELSPDGTIGTIGITAHAAYALGDIVYVELPALQAVLKAGDTLGAVESVKSASDIITPVSGTVVERNDVLEERPGVLNQGPEAEGWIVRVRVEDRAEVEGLMGKEEYARYAGE
ncbi:MAG: glycine cleavage system H-protein subunit [Geoglossum umbratile]|nr:MAG: glycine cleavage system H-protein subunit [Geoglossum umbratile]